jgi:hypothetical protein
LAFGRAVFKLFRRVASLVFPLPPGAFGEELETTPRIAFGAYFTPVTLGRFNKMVVVLWFIKQH